MNRNTTEDNHDAEENLRREVALFRYGLIADLAHLAPGTPGIREQLRAKAEPQYTIPGTLRTRVAAETLRDWLQHYRRGGFDALYPKRRADLGRPRRLPAQAAELLIALKTEHPTWSVRQVIAGAIASGHLPDGVRLAHSTVHRLLRAEGLMSKPTAAATSSASSTTPPACVRSPPPRSGSSGCTRPRASTTWLSTSSTGTSSSVARAFRAPRRAGRSAHRRVVGARLIVNVSRASCSASSSTCTAIALVSAAFAELLARPSDP